MSDVIKIKKSTLSTLFWIFLSIIFIYWIFGSTEIFGDTTTFIFESENEERFDGNVYINDYFIGNTEDGKIKVSRQISLADEVTFEGNYNSTKFIFYYEFEAEDLDLSEIIFPVEQKDIIYYQKRNKDSFSNVSYVHWSHIPITYKFENNNTERQINLVRDAFKRIAEETSGVVLFQEVVEDQDISIYYKPFKNENYRAGHTFAEALITEKNLQKNLIISGEITFYGQGFVCLTGYPSLEVHEILHLFEIPHNPFTRSIMSPYTAESSENCEIKEIDEEYISCLRYVYSNGQINGSCDFPNVVHESSSCPEGYYEVLETDYCCPEPNMIINEEGYCYFSE